MIIFGNTELPSNFWQLVEFFHLLIFFFFFNICLFGRQSEWEHFPSTGSCSTWPQWLELSQANQEPWAPSVFHMGGKGPMTWAICCFPMCIRELDGKWSQLEHWTGAHMECWYCRWQLQLLCSSLIPLFYLDSGCSTASRVCSCFVIFFPLLSISPVFHLVSHHTRVSHLKSTWEQQAGPGNGLRLRCGASCEFLPALMGVELCFLHPFQCGFQCCQDYLLDPA